MRAVDEGIQKFPCDKKVNKIFFRGWASGLQFDYFPQQIRNEDIRGEDMLEALDNKTETWQRVAFVRLGNEYPDIIDAAITGHYDNLQEHVYWAFAKNERWEF